MLNISNVFQTMLAELCAIVDYLSKSTLYIFPEDESGQLFPKYSETVRILSRCFTMKIFSHSLRVSSRPGFIYFSKNFTITLYMYSGLAN